MVWLEKGDSFLPKHSKEELKKLYLKEKDTDAKFRLLAAMKRKDGETLDYIALSLKKPKTTIHDWLKRFQTYGPERIYNLKKSGRPSNMSKEQKQNLKNILMESPEKQGLPFIMWTTSLVQYLIDKLFGILYKIRNIEYIIKELGFSFKKPRPENKKSNKKAQERFKIELKKKLNITLNLDSRSFVLTKLTSS